MKKIDFELKMETENHSNGAEVKRKMSRINYFWLFTGSLILLSCTASCNQQLPDRKAAKDFLSAVENCDHRKFNWLKENDLDNIKFLKDEGYDKTAEEVKADLLEMTKRWNSNEMNEKLCRLKESFVEEGFDFTSYSIEDSKIIKEKPEETMLGFLIIEGYYTVKSNNKTFTIAFSTVISDKNQYRYFDMDSPHVTGNESEAPTKNDESVALIQNKDFETFIFSLAACFRNDKKSEIEKIVLKDNRGKMVIFNEGMNPVNFIGNINGQKFTEAISTHNYKSEEQNYAQLIAWGIIDNFDLEEDEISEHSKVWAIQSADENVLSGIYFTYKGNWYIWQMY